MKSIRYLQAALLAAIAITGVAHSAPAFATNSDNPNDAAYWQSRAGAGSTCVKHNPGDSISQNNSGDTTRADTAQ